MYSNRNEKCSRCNSLFCNVLRSLPPNTPIKNILILDSNNKNLNSGVLKIFNRNNCIATFTVGTATSNIIFEVSCNRIIGLEYAISPTP